MLPLTHSGSHTHAQPLVACHHPILDKHPRSYTLEEIRARVGNGLVLAGRMDIYDGVPYAISSDRQYLRSLECVIEVIACICYASAGLAGSSFWSNRTG